MADEPKPPKPKQPPPFKYGEPEKTNWFKRFLLWAFVVLAIWGIVYMIYTNKRMPSLNCQEYTGAGLWSSFGRCTED